MQHVALLDPPKVKPIRLVPDLLASITAEALVRERPSGSSREGRKALSGPWRNVTGAAMKTLSRILSWLDQAAENAQRRRYEQYLGQATDVVDLEHRMQELDRNAIAEWRGW